MAVSVKINVDNAIAKRKLDRLAREMKPEKILRVVAIEQQSWIMSNFRREGIERRWPRLSKNTIAQRRKKSSKPLQDTGRLRNSLITPYARKSSSSDSLGNITGNVLTIGTTIRTAPAHEYGTAPRKIKAKGKALTFVGSTEFAKAVGQGKRGGRVFFKSVNHPGIPKRKMLPTVRLAGKLSVDAVNALFRKIVNGRN